jgi:hypothetical protein
VLEVPAHYAFNFLADPATAKVIDPAILEYRPDPLPMRLGTRNAIRLRMWGVPLRATSIVQEWQPGAARLFSRFMRSNAATQQDRFKAEVERRWHAEPATRR